MTDEEKLTKIHVDLPNHWATSGESLWVVEIGPDHYEIRNLPVYAYSLNLADVVEARSEQLDLNDLTLGVARITSQAPYCNDNRIEDFARKRPVEWSLSSCRGSSMPMVCAS